MANDKRQPLRLLNPFRWDKNAARDAEAEDTKPTLKRYFVLLYRRFWKLISLNLLMIPMALPFLLIFILFISAKQTPTETEPVFSILFGIDLALKDLFRYGDCRIHDLFLHLVEHLVALFLDVFLGIRTHLFRLFAAFFRDLFFQLIACSFGIFQDLLSLLLGFIDGCLGLFVESFVFLAQSVRFGEPAAFVFASGIQDLLYRFPGQLVHKEKQQSRSAKLRAS